MPGNGMEPHFFQHRPVLIVAAHPDDETIGLGGQVGVLKDAYIIHVTDGAPRSTPSRARYALARRREFRAAMDLVDVKRNRCLKLGAADQESSFSLSSLTRLLFARLVKIEPKVIFTHSYEGGHPDHDACAFIVQAAVNMIQPGMDPPLRVEFTSYHNGTPHSNSSRMQVGAFLSGPPVTTIALTRRAQGLKRRMFAHFKTQQHVLKDFPIGQESFRVAQYYNFSKAPHPGKLYYEGKGWGVDCGAEWRRLALDAAGALQPAFGAGTPKLV
jgi:N-acetylglucosamine malate deacetylase 2